MPRLTPAAFALAVIALTATHARVLAQYGLSAIASHASANAQPTAPQNAPQAVGNQLITQAAAQLERRASVSARLWHQIQLPGKQLISGRGSYWQQGTGDELRVRLELQIAGQEASLLQVSDSRFLWVERRLPIGRTVTRLDLRQLRAEAIMAASQLGEIQPGNAHWMSMQPELIAQSGGLPSLLMALGDCFTFLPPQTMRLAIRTENGQKTSNPYFAVVGHWKKDKLAALLTKRAKSGELETGSEDSQSAPLNPPPATPARLPEEVLLLFGQADLFPYRIEYRKLETPIAANQAGAAIPYQLSNKPMVVLEFSDVRFDVPTDGGQFEYKPGDAEWTDTTAAALERLRLAREQLANRAAPAVIK